MSTKQKHVTQTLRPWLKANLGARCLGGLTGSDSALLDSAACIIQAYSYSDSRQRPRCIAAFGHVVTAMQPSQQYLAYHAIAHVLDWGDRCGLWGAAGLPGETIHGVCAYEPAARRAA